MQNDACFVELQAEVANKVARQTKKDLTVSAKSLILFGVGNEIRSLIVCSLQRP